MLNDCNAATQFVATHEQHTWCNDCTKWGLQLAIAGLNLIIHNVALQHAAYPELQYAAEQNVQIQLYDVD